MDPYTYFELVLTDAEPGFCPKPDQRPAAKWNRWWQAQFDILADSAIGRRAQESGFVVTRADALCSGSTSAHVRHAVACGRLSAPAHGIVSPIVVPPTADRSSQPLAARREHALRAAGAALRQRDHVISGRSAAVLHGSPTLPVPTRPEVTATGPATLGRHHGALVRSATTTDEDVTTWFGARVTTVVDLARHDRRDGLMAADAALYERLTTRDRLMSSVDEAAGWPGVRQPVPCSRWLTGVVSLRSRRWCDSRCTTTDSRCRDYRSGSSVIGLTSCGRSNASSSRRTVA